MKIHIAVYFLIVKLSIAFKSHNKPAFLSKQLQLFVTPSPDAAILNDELLSSIKYLRTQQEKDGYFAIDFGVKGGELNSTSRAPQKVNYYAISENVGAAADGVIGICEKLGKISPTEEPTQYLGDKMKGNLSPLNGAWKLLFTTAADASFSKNSTRGDAKAQNVVDAGKGRITNIIDFYMKEDGTEPLLKQLNVVIKATALSSHRVGLQFKFVKAKLTKFLFLPIKWSLYIPVPAAFITRCIVFFSRVFKGQAKTVPQAYFDVLYLDDDLRIHKTGEDNLFVQAKDTWENAKELLK